MKELFKVTTYSNGEKVLPLSAILRAMVKGLRDAEADANCVVNMATFLRQDVQEHKTVCFGCAATFALQELSGIPVNDLPTDKGVEDGYKDGYKVDHPELLEKVNAYDGWRGADWAKLEALVDALREGGSTPDMARSIQRYYDPREEPTDSVKAVARLFDNLPILTTSSLRPSYIPNLELYDRAADEVENMELSLAPAST